MLARIIQRQSNRRLSRNKTHTNTRFIATKTWSKVKLGPVDAILGLNVAFNQDPNPKKVNLGVGAYRTNEGKPFVLECVREAESAIFKGKNNHEYSGIGGTEKFCDLSRELVFGPDPDLNVATVQTISGTGALRVAGEFLRKYVDHKDIYVSDPTWGNHIPIFRDSGFNVKTYRYYDGDGGLDFEGMIEDLEEMPENSIVLLHACAHNPTGIDPTKEQWNRLSSLFDVKKHIPFFDSAYQGFATGNLENDAYSIRRFVNDGHRPIVTQSYAKNMGLYGERVGALHIVARDAMELNALDSQLKINIRPMYSNPPIHGARLVTEVLSNPELKKLWLSEIVEMSDRIQHCRHRLVGGLKNAGSTKDWGHITNQIGMFCYTGLSMEQVDTLVNNYSIYLTKDGRISIAGINDDNVDYVATAIHEASLIEN
eukprot:TRINITY_DN2321_c0_g1_i1.p1 TRINITY_DN2321_c0_g1~~TRINITY_DN2321_c0_g1_i1.p1  ORF type:complete len:426 (-),score=118.31 TRINITY_DN2321_c0_g1_i1:1163-2440(-)